MIPITNRTHARMARFAVQHIRRAGRICRRYFAGGFAGGRGVEYKGDGSPVTAADRAVEHYLTTAIGRAYPHHTIVGEEYNPTAPAEEHEYRWYIDPIDGTFSFIHGIPLYTCLLALYHNGEPLLGVIYNPELDELVVAGAGAGCYFNGRRTMVTTCNEIGTARMLCTDVPLLLREAPNALRLLERCGSMRTWCDAYGYVLLVTGRGDLVLDVGMQPWDVAPLYVIVREAGGVISDFSGASAPLAQQVIATAAGSVSRVARQILNN